MSAPGEIVDAAAFVAGLLAREGALSEVDGRGAVAAVLPEELQQATGLAESATLRVGGAPEAGETALPLESAVLRWCVDRASARGRIAAAELHDVRTKAQDLSAAAAQFGALNGSLRPVATRVARFRAWILEFRYEAVGEERSEGSLHVAFEPALRSLSAPLAGLLLERSHAAAPAAPDLDPCALARAAAAVEPHARTLLTARLAPLRASLARRMARDAERLHEYHTTLLSEARRRRRGSEPAESLSAKAAAITRQQDEKLRDLAFRYSVEVRCSLASVLELSYPVAVCDVVFLRRRREIPLVLPWDPFLRGVPPIACPPCGGPSLAFHACDEQGHLICAVCARPCTTCDRVTCRACQPCGCRTRTCADKRGQGST